jgi:hypothetical protein
MASNLLKDFEKILAAEEATQVNLSYCDENGTVVQRTIFPYRLTVSRDGNVVVHCYRPGYLNDAGRTVPGAYRHCRLDHEQRRVRPAHHELADAVQAISLRQDHPRTPTRAWHLRGLHPAPDAAARRRPGLLPVGRAAGSVLERGAAPRRQGLRLRRARLLQRKPAAGPQVLDPEKSGG